MLLGTLALFLALVACKVHGSAIAHTTKTWAPESALSHFIASPLLKRMTPRAQTRWRRVLMADPPYIRMDEWGTWTPWALAQFSHVPRFPVINGNIGGGQNMLIAPWVPVAHVATLARPMTWGYLLLGPERGLAWAWWSQVFGCFTALYLLFELIVPKRPRLAALGAGWYCGSAYVICFSQWPAYVTGLAASAVVCAYWLFQSQRRGVIIASGVGVGLSVAGFGMQLYPPWQIPLGEALLVIFGALVWQDRLWATWSSERRARMIGLGLAVVSLALVFGTFLASSKDALHALANSAYPGHRRLLGGDLPAYGFVAGFFNFFTVDVFAKKTDPIACAGFFLLFPAVLVAAAVSPRIRRQLGPVVWILLPYLALLTYYCVATVPQWLASATLLTYVLGNRSQVALGLMSIVLCLRLLAVTSELPRSRQTLGAALAVFVVCAGLFFWQSIGLHERYEFFVGVEHPRWLWVISLGAAALAALMTLGLTRWFALALAVALTVTSGTFNPLSVGFPDWRSGELATAVRQVLERDRAEHEQPALWLTYGGPTYPNNGIVGQIMGARTLGGVYGYPQLDFWEPLDPTRANEDVYNRFAVAHLMSVPASNGGIRIALAAYLVFRVWVSPLNPALREMGTRYVLTFDEQPNIASPPLTLLYKSETRGFAIWQLPDANP